MGRQIETGHGKNIANFKKLLDQCKGLGAKYNPSAQNIAVDALEKLYNAARTSAKKLNAAETSLNNAVNARAITFEDNKMWATRIVNAFDISEADARAKEDVKGINRRIQGQRAEKLPKKEDEAASAEGKEPKHISVSHQGYDNQCDHFEKLLEALGQDGNYNPNEQDLTLAAIAKKVEEMVAATDDLNIAGTKYQHSLIKRNQVMYETGSGMLDIVKNVKKYIKSIYSTNAPEFKKINAIRFRK